MDWRRKEAKAEGFSLLTTSKKRDFKEGTT